MTKTFTDFYNDPSLAGEPKPLREVHAARLLIASETEGLSPSQWAETTNANAAAIAQKYGLKIAFDYTEWRQDLFKDTPLEKFLQDAEEYGKMLEKEEDVLQA